jgi:hypothetical protein
VKKFFIPLPDGVICEIDPELLRDYAISNHIPDGWGQHSWNEVLRAIVKDWVAREQQLPFGPAAGLDHIWRGYRG